MKLKKEIKILEKSIVNKMFLKNFNVKIIFTN